MDQLTIAILMLFVALAGVVGLGGLIAAGIALSRVAALRQEVAAARREIQWQRDAGVQARKAATAPAPQVPTAAQPVGGPVASPVSPPAPAVTPDAPLPAARPAAMPLSGVQPKPLTWRASTLGWTDAAAAKAQERESIESKIGQKWIAWVGAVVVFLSAVFFLKHAFDNDWIGPTGQVAISVVLAAGVAAAGSYFIGRKWRVLGQCLIGLGISVMYAAFFAAFQVYHPPVMGQDSAFAAMIFVTVAGMTLAVLHDAVAIAFIALLGGILTPVLVSTGQDSRDVLFSYMLLLDLGVIAVAFFRGWRAVDTLALAGTFAMYQGWFSKFYSPEGMGPALAWLAAFYVLFLLLPFVYHLVKCTPVTVERFLMAVANAAFCGGYAWYILRDEYLFTMGFVALSMAAAYLVIGALIRRRLPGDATSLFGTIAMAVTFLTLAIPMQLQAEGIMLAWVAEAPVLVFLGYRYRYSPVRVFGLLVLAIGMGRLLLYHWPQHMGLFVPFVNKQFLSALAVPAAGAAVAMLHGWWKGEAGDAAMKYVAGLVSGLLALTLVSTEAWDWFAQSQTMAEYSGVNAGVAIWATGAAVYAVAALRGGHWRGWTWATGAVAILVAALFECRGFIGLDMPQHLLFTNWRFLAGALLVGVIFGYAWQLWKLGAARQPIEQVFGGFCLLGGIVASLVLLSAEVYSFCVDGTGDRVSAQRAGQMSITLVWSLYAVTLLMIGFWKRFRPLRLGGLALFGIAALKLVLIDLGFLKDIYRIVSFLVLGLLMLTASYLYHRLEKRLETALGGAESGSGGAAGGTAGGETTGGAV